MSEQHNATASQCLAMPKLYMSVPMLCHSIALLFNAETKRTLTLPKPCAVLPCPSPACLRRTLPLLRSSSQCHRLAVLCHRLNVLYSAHALKLTARTLHRYSMPLLRYARLDLSVQCLGDMILVIAFARRFVSLPLLSLSSQCHRFARPCHR